MTQEELSDKDPFGGEAEPDLISPPMVKKATALIHRLAERRGADFKAIQKRCKEYLGYENLAKVTMEDGHKIIDELVRLTGGEEEQPQQGARVTDDGSKAEKIKEKPAERSENKEIENLEYEIRDLAIMLRICVSNSREIVSQELGKENITEGTQAMLVKSFAATLFIEASRRGLGR